MIKENTFNDFNLRTVNIFLGYQGIGKTATLTALAYLFANAENKRFLHYSSVEHLKNNNYKLDCEDLIIPNYNLLLKKRGRDMFKFEAQDIESVLKFKTHIAEHSLLLIDEGQDLFNARKWQQTDRRASKFCEFARHFNLTICFSCQDLYAIDKTFRGYSKIYLIKDLEVYSVYGEKCKKGQKFKNIDIDYIVIKYRSFERECEYLKYLSRPDNFLNDIFDKKIVINANLFDMYNHDYLKKEFLEKKNE